MPKGSRGLRDWSIGAKRQDGWNPLNGRCEKDALDRAEDICELCGNQFCASCLLYPRGRRKPPTCKGCALANSGLRGTGAVDRAISRREYKNLKKELLAQLDGVEQTDPEFTFFDLNDPTEFHKPTELDRRPTEPDEPAPLDILATADVPPPVDPPPPTATNDNQLPPPPPSPPVEPEIVESHGALDGTSPVDTSINPLAVGGPVTPPPPAPPVDQVSEASASAAELLARLKADQPIQSQFTPTQRTADADPFAIESLVAGDSLPAAEPLTAEDFDDMVATRPVGNPFDPSPSPEPAMPAAPAPPAFVPPTPKRETAEAPVPRPKIDPWTPPTPPPRGSNLDAIAAHEQAAPEPAPPAPGSVPDALRPPSNQPDPFEGTREQQTADTDDTGQWIPPVLRGMAPVDERAADPLPKRR